MYTLRSPRSKRPGWCICVVQENHDASLAQPVWPRRPRRLRVSTDSSTCDSSNVREVQTDVCVHRKESQHSE